MDKVSASGSLRLLILPSSDLAITELLATLQGRQIESHLCRDLAELECEYLQGAGGVLLPEEAFETEAIAPFLATLQTQPNWSDFPLLCLTRAEQSSNGAITPTYGNLSLVSRPIERREFLSAVEARLRDRRRQYATRDLIAQRDCAIQATIENERRLSKALQAGTMAAWEWQPQGSVWSPELYTLLGVSSQVAASPETFFDSVHPEDRLQVQEMWERATLGLDEYDTEFRIVRPDGEVRWLRGVGEVLRDRSNNITHVFGLNWDITAEHVIRAELSRAHESASQASQAKSEFLAKMSHEIRSPMSAVLGYAEVLMRQEKSPEKSRCLQAIKRNGEFLIEIINDILDLSKIEAGKLEINRDWIDLRQLIADVEAMMRGRAEDRGLDFQIRFEGFIPSQVQTDSKRLRQILINLLGNAIKFTEQGSVTLIARCLTETKKPLLEFAVIDTGIGMPADQIGRLFQTFSQGDASVERTYGGTGLGLAISKQLATLLGGEISCQSTPGLGSTFTVRVEAGDIAGLNSTPPEPSAFASAEGEELESERLSCRVLIVDDRRDVRFLAQHVLEGAGAGVLLADDGEQALQIYSEQSAGGSTIDLVLLDMQMPRLDGYCTAQRLRTLGFMRPIIALTADAMAGDRERSMQAGCNAYLCKPIDRKELLRTVSHLLRHANQAMQTS